MSKENLDLARRSVEAFNDRDIPALESICSEDFVYRLSLRRPRGAATPTAPVAR